MKILSVVRSYALAYDDRDLDLFDRVLADAASFEGSVVCVGDIKPIVGRAAVIGWLRSHMSQQADQQRHTIHNELISAQTA